MKKIEFRFFLLIFFIIPMCTTKSDNKINPPVAMEKPKNLIKHNHTRVDPYYWMKERENPEVLKYLKQENAYTKEILKPTEKTQQIIFEEIVSRIKKEDQTAPYMKNGYFYYARFEKENEYPVYCRKKATLDSEEQVFLDVQQLSENFQYIDVKGLKISPNNRFLSYGLDTVSRRRYDIRFKDLHTAEYLPDVIKNTSGQMAWANDNKTIFYVEKDLQTLREYKVKKHIIGTPVANDRTVYIEQDSTFYVSLYRSKSGSFIFIKSSSTLTDEINYIDAGQPEQNPVPFQKRVKGLEYEVDHLNGMFFIRTNDDAKNYRIMECAEGNTSKTNWEEVIPHGEDQFIEDYEVFENHLAYTIREHGVNKIRIIDLKTSTKHSIQFDEKSYVAHINVNEDPASSWLRISYSSLSTPYSIYDYNLKTNEKKLIKEQEVVGSFDKEDYHTERIYAKASDGVRVPISLVYKKSEKKESGNPLLLYAYGSYGISSEPYFSSERLSLLDRGFIFAIAHVRGGQELGKSWYEEGRLLKKKNTFADFVACSKYLIRENYTSEDRLFAIGGSAGGLLMGVIANTNPDLYKGIVAMVPFVDVITTMLDETIPLTTSEYDEWGNPNQKEYYDYMLSYSPYDNVTRQDYPAILVTAGLHDSQVQYWEPAKWVAKLRKYKTDHNPVLLHTNMKAGHSGVSGRFEPYRETALIYAFLLMQMDALPS